MRQQEATDRTTITKSNPTSSGTDRGPKSGTTGGTTTTKPKKKFRFSAERIVFWMVSISAVIIVCVNVSLLSQSIAESEDHHSLATSVISANFDKNDNNIGAPVRGGSANHEETANAVEKFPEETKQHPEQETTASKPSLSSSSKKQQQQQSPPSFDDKIDERLLRILRHVGIENSTQLSEEELFKLPTWEQVVERVGDGGPKILGLDTCKKYKESVPRDDRELGVAGPFNSGTHYLFDVLRKNCVYDPPPRKRNKQKKNGILYQVPWGKHQSPRYRLLHNTGIGTTLLNANEKDEHGVLKHPPLPPHLEANNRNTLPVVMVRDPFTWWQSMCRVRYSAHWFHVVPDHCPNFIANEVEKEWFHKPLQVVKKHFHNDVWLVDNLKKANFTLDKKVVPLWVKYHSENRQHESLAHMWTDWYKDYYDADYPRLMVRLEDLVFYPHETLKQICECANGVGGDGEAGGKAGEEGRFSYVGDENLELSLGSSIQSTKNDNGATDRIHGKDRTGLLGAMAKHAGPHSDVHRTTGMTQDDLDFARGVLGESETVSFFGYGVPDSVE